MKSNFELVNYQEEEITKKYNNKNFLPIGPVRCDKLPCELPWDNVTKRHYKSSNNYNLWII